jgi:hypothetical protein
MTNYSYLFTNSVLKNIFNNDVVNIKNTINELKLSYREYGTLSLGGFYEKIYKKLTKTYQNEYIFKNAIANKVLLGRHSVNSSSLYTELRIGASKADVVIFNGTSHVYEIKTKYDSFDRLENQLKNYKDFFEYINIVTVESKVNALKSLVDEDVGILVLTSQYTLSTIRKATSNKKNIKKSVLFDVLKKDEYLSIIKNHYGHIPNVPNTQIFSKSKELFEMLDIQIAHKEVLKALKQRKSHKNLRQNIKKFPSALRVEILNSNFNIKTQDKILELLNTTLDEIFSKKESHVLSVS